MKRARGVNLPITVRDISVAAGVILMLAIVFVVAVIRSAASARECEQQIAAIAKQQRALGMCLQGGCLVQVEDYLRYMDTVEFAAKACPADPGVHEAHSAP